MCIQHNASKYGCHNLGAINRTWIHLKKSHFAIRETRFNVDPTIEYAPVCHAALRVASAMVSKTRIHAAANVDTLFMQTRCLANDTNF
ncbi:hypothetical protein TNCV_3388831 [Trichonephila clavipes]|nr:hypothetical protein TNCV_3388831 [Trichonephila clavipes]